MKNVYAFIFSLTIVTALSAQTADSVIIGSGYPNRAYYSLANGEQSQALNNNWDLAFSTASMTATIRINGRFGVQLFQYVGGDTSDWATIDTTGLNSDPDWTRNYDPDTTWDYGSFEYNATGHPNYGWGNYNSITHVVEGNQVFVIKTISNGWKKMWIKDLSTAGVYSIRLANLNGSSDTVIQVNKSGLTNKNFLFYSLTGFNTLDVDEDNSMYDLIFMAYEGEIMPGVWYPVTGVLGNTNVLIVEARNIHEDDADYTQYTFGDQINEIGSDWKAFQGSWVIEDSLSYFIRRTDGSLWQIWFTGFASTGKFVFNKRQLEFASVEENGSSLAEFMVYPNPATEYVKMVYTNPTGFENGTVRIAGMDGRIHYEQALSDVKGFHELNIPVGQMSFAPGIYVISLQVNGVMASHKLIIQ